MGNKFKIMEVSANKEKVFYGFNCPGCNCLHFVQVNKKFKPCWDFNNDLKNPTVNPSIKVDLGNNNICHSFITDGQIRFLGDCFHDLKNETVALPDF